MSISCWANWKEIWKRRIDICWTRFRLWCYRIALCWSRRWKARICSMSSKDNTCKNLRLFLLNGHIFSVLLQTHLWHLLELYGNTIDSRLTETSWMSWGDRRRSWKRRSWTSINSMTHRLHAGKNRQEFSCLFFVSVDLPFHSCLICPLQTWQLDHLKDEEVDQAKKPWKDALSHTDSVSIRTGRCFPDLSPG